MGTEDEHPQTVALPTHVVERVEDRLPYTEFDSVDDYVSFVVEEVLYAVEAADDEDLEAVDEAEVRSRLESLGYLE